MIIKTNSPEALEKYFNLVLLVFFYIFTLVGRYIGGFNFSVAFQLIYTTVSNKKSCSQLSHVTKHFHTLLFFFSFLFCQVNKMSYFGFSPVLFCLRVGLTYSCSEKTFEDGAKSCINDFYSALKRNPKQDCRYVDILLCM